MIIIYEFLFRFLFYLKLFPSSILQECFENDTLILILM